MKWLLGVFKFVLFCVVVIAVVVVVLMNAGFSAVGPGPQQRIHIDQDDSGGAIARKLKDANLIRSTLAFQVLMKLRKADTHLVAGDYILSPAEDPETILGHIEHGDNVIRFVTFPEGWTARQMALRLSDDHLEDEPDFLNAVTHPPDKYSSFGGSLEGFLFPDTYDVPAGTTAADLVGRMVDRFDEKVSPEWQKHHGRTTLNLLQTVILASLVEREAQVPSERPHIAGVLYNRLQKGMPLQCDATIQYALGKVKPVLSLKDLEIESPYNTYKHTGLPPGPICNPGLSCLEAAMAPMKTDDLYYVRNDVKNDGSHVFARTYEEHEDNIRKYQK
ncbi:MAG: endolytic transglycosylase MltG [Candidatus Xenobia bacterium]